MSINSEEQIEYILAKASKLGLTELIPKTQIDYFVAKSKNILQEKHSTEEVDTSSKQNSLNYTHPSQIVANNFYIQEVLKKYCNFK